MTEIRHERRCACGQVIQPDPRTAVTHVRCSRCGAEMLLTGYVKMDVALSESCNYRCKMCRRPPDPATLKTRDVIAVMEQAVQVGIQVVSFCGGEPFVHKDFVEIARKGVELGLVVQVTTNGGLVTREKLEGLRGIDCLTVSIDGMEKTHDEIRGFKGAFARACEALRLAADAGITRGTNTVIQRDNTGQLLDLFHHLVDVTDGRLDYVRHAPVEVVPATTELMVPQGEFQGVVDQLRAIAAECDRRGIWFSHRKQLLEHFELYANKWHRRRPLGGCHIPRRFVGYSDHGFYLCWHQGHSIKNPRLIDALESEVAADVVARGLESRCAGCNALTYSWDEEWNEAMLAGQLASEGEISEQTTIVHGSWGSTLAGVNWPWLDDSYNHDLAHNERYPGWGRSFTPLAAFRHIALSRDLGFRAMRIWLCENREGVVTDARGHTAGVMPELLEAVRVVQEGAALAGMKIYWSFLDANAWKRNGDELTGRIASDPDETARFAAKVVVPVCRILDPGTTFAIEVFNEPESLSKEVHQRDGLDWKTIVRSILTVRSAIHGISPGIPVTSGCQAVFLPGLLADMRAGGPAPVDAVDLHVYHEYGGLPYRADLPVDIGDMPVIIGEAGPPEDGSADAQVYENYLYNARSLGYAACFLWKLAGPSHMVTRLKDEALHRDVFVRTARGVAVQGFLRDNWT